jgi:formate dehydrogenase iron-sulfur subunit
MKSYAILTDVTRCIGCEECVAACKRTNGLSDQDAPWRWQGKATDLSATRWTTIERTAEGRYVRVHCRHCLDPACAAACPVGALRKTAEGAVAYDPDICMGCRYCMVACPFRMTRYEWDSPVPRVRKCILCYEKLQAGELTEPACTAACPREATIFGEREALLAEARRRIETGGGRYLRHIWGEHEVGGTSVLYISDVDLAAAGWPDSLPGHDVPELAHQVLNTVPMTFVTVGGLMTGIHWVVKRRQKLAAEAAVAGRSAMTGSAEAPAAASPPATTSSDSEPESEEQS